MPTTRPLNEGVPAGLVGDQSIRSVERAIGKLTTSFDETAKITMVLDGTLADAAAYLSESGVVLGFPEELSGRPVRGRFIDRLLADVLRSLATQLGPEVRVVSRPGPSYYIGKPGEDDVAVAVLNVPEGEATQWRDVYQTAATSSAKVATYGDRIVIRDSFDGLARIADLHRDILTARPQYVVEVVFIEMSWNVTQLFGIDWNLTGGVDMRWATQEPDLASAFLSFQMVFNATNEAATIRVVDSMTLHCLEGGTAEVQSGESIPILRRQTFENGAVRDVGFDTVDTGRLLRVSVRGAGASGVAVSVEPELSTVSRYVGEVPVVTRKRVTSNAVVDFGGTIVLGGLESNTDSEQSRGFPGFAWGSERHDARRTRLFMFVRVTGVRNGN